MGKIQKVYTKEFKEEAVSDSSLEAARSVGSMHQQFLHQVDLLTQAFSEEDLNASHRFSWTESWPGASVIAAIADNSFEQYDDHIQQIQHLLDTSKKDAHNHR